MRKLVAAGALSASLAAGPVGAVEPFSTWDTDASGVLEELEFRLGVQQSGLLERWDTDADGLLDRAELAEGLYGAWDADGDGSISVSEWDAAVDRWFGEREVDLSVETWDDDGNGAISRAEFDEALEQTDLFARFEADDDEDNLIVGEELADGVFEVADVDDELGVDEDELDALGLFDEEQEIVGAPDDIGLIEEGESFVQLPIPCGSSQGEDQDCRETAERFCATLGYGPPIAHLAKDGALYLIRCRDEP